MPRNYIKIIVIIIAFLSPALVLAAPGLSINFSNNNSELLLGNPSVAVNDKVYISYFEFEETSRHSQGEYTLTITDWYEKNLVTVRFDARGPQFSLLVPYYNTVQTLSVYRSATYEKIITYDLSSISTCNSNKRCEYEKGETAQTCIVDCAVSNPVFSPDTQKLLNDNNGQITDDSGKVLIKGEVKKNKAPIGKNILIISVVSFFVIVTALVILSKKNDSSR